ncbi:Hit family protein 1 [Seminavis robusta]|uniref:Hit family protein 1 n=1 Tax=Seminavis robusta TaxID=568900 RepID=A0A9N8DT31_9STRA|nr:Hit family protein 1 [Seminavis robusta]|eukprot:Sro231_g093610.1 Hit family protein 1 (197) ;mRNA; f:46967-47557
MNDTTSTTTRAQSSSSATAKTNDDDKQQLLLEPNCIFCKILSDQIPGTKVYEDDVCLILMDIHPIRPGHVLIIPTRHYDNIMDMPPTVAQHMMTLAHQMTAALTTRTSTSSTTEQFTCHGTNLLWNNGRAAWQTVMHAHLHVIPRQKGDGLGFLWGIIRHFLSLLGILPPANRQELDRLAALFRQALLTQQSKKST